MKKLKRIICLLCLFCVTMCCVSCVGADVDIEIKEDGSATMSSKMMIEEELYHTLENLDTLPEATENGIADHLKFLDLKKFNKTETVDGKTFYVCEQELTEYATYADLVQDLRQLKVADSVYIFDSIDIANNRYTDYSFMIKTTAITPLIEDGVSLFGNLEGDWLRLVLTVTMPGSVENVEASDGVVVEKIGESTYRFEVNDFSKEQAFSIRSEASRVVFIVILVAVVLCIVVVMFVVFSRRRREDDDSNSDKKDEDTDKGES